VGATTIFEYEAHEMIGQPSTHIISPELREEETQILTRLQQDERIRHYETVRVAKDGRRVESAVRGLSEIPIKLIVGNDEPRSGSNGYRRRAERVERPKASIGRTLRNGEPRFRILIIRTPAYH
jgi:PAS domain-containing protein